MEKAYFKRQIIECERKSLFIGANTENGFKYADKTLFNEVNYDRCFILKGSAGGGKSTFIKKALTLAEKRGFDTVEYRCSSDPYSLDAGIITYNDKSCLLIDGTAPHSMDSEFPLLCSQYVDLSVCASKKKLYGYKDELIYHAEMKKKAFAKAYSYLNCRHTLSKPLYELVYRYVDLEKTKGAAKRLIEKIRPRPGKLKTEYIGCLSMKGEFLLDTYIKQAKQIYIVTPYMGIENIFMKICADFLSETQCDFCLCRCPYDSSNTDVLFINGNDILILIQNNISDNVKSINMKRFATSDLKLYKGEYRFIDKCRNELKEGALAELKKAEEHHFALENIYIGASDFSVSDDLFDKTFADYIKSF